MVAHANPRLYVGPKTNQIIIDIGRANGSYLICDHPNIVLKLRRRGHKHSTSYEMTSYVVNADSCAHFEISDEFLSEAPKGFYDAKLITVPADDCDKACVFGKLEIIKAPGHYIKGANTTDTCNKTMWVEPTCDPEKRCGCGRSKSDDGCLYCNKKYITAKVKTRDGYGITRVNNVVTADETEVAE